MSTRFVFLAIAVAACAHVSKEAPVWTTITISDGSANGFSFTRGADGRVQFVYRPITKAESSSGMYDGGPPRREELAADDARLSELWSLLQRVEADKSIQTEERGKGTGAISWDGADGKRSFILQMNSSGLNELLALLKRFGT